MAKPLGIYLAYMYTKTSGFPNAPPPPTTSLLIYTVKIIIRPTTLLHPVSCCINSLRYHYDKVTTIACTCSYGLGYGMIWIRR